MPQAYFTRSKGTNFVEKSTCNSKCFFHGGDGGNRNRVRNLILTNFYERIRLFKIPSAHRPTAVYALW